MRAFLAPAILAGVVGIGFAFVVHDGTVDAGRFVTFVPVGAVAVLILALLARSLAPVRASTAPRRSRRGNPVALLLVGAVGTGVSGALALSAAWDASAFAHDPTCGGAGGAGACRDARATIVRAYHRSGKGGGSDHLQLALDDGTRPDVTVGRRVSGDAWNGARGDGDTRAFVRVFRGRVVSVSTASGFLYTSAYPPYRAGQTAIAAGAFGCMFAVGIALRAAMPRRVS